jgi:hypothetical protein
MGTETSGSIELARAYVALTVPAVRAAVKLSLGKLAPLAELLDWVRVLEPCAQLMAAELTEAELRQAVAWAETPLYAKMAALAPRIQEVTQAGLMQALDGGDHG